MLGDGDKATELFALINPINHALTADAVRRYAVEPYIVAADVYSEPPHVRRGGWTWYTGSGGWMYRAGLERILGFRVQAADLVLDPCIPASWPSFDIAFRNGTAHYDINVENPFGVRRGIAHAELDGVPLMDVSPGAGVRRRLADDGRTHHVRVVLG